MHPPAPRRAIAVAVAIAILATGTAAAAFRVGIDTYGRFDSSSRATWAARAASENAQVVRVAIYWAAVAPPSLHPGFVQQDPSSRFYSWAAVDALARAVAARRLPIMIEITGAPRWAEGPPRAGTAPGTWIPESGRVRSLRAGRCQRYSGHFPDPLHPGRFLPRVRYWEAWNEPNLPEYLTPQWVRHGGRYVAVQPDPVPRPPERVLRRRQEGVPLRTWCVGGGHRPVRRSS